MYIGSWGTVGVVHYHSVAELELESFLELFLFIAGSVK